MLSGIWLKCRRNDAEFLSRGDVAVQMKICDDIVEDWNGKVQNVGVDEWVK